MNWHLFIDVLSWFSIGYCLFSHIDVHFANKGCWIQQYEVYGAANLAAVVGVIALLTL